MKRNNLNLRREQKITEINNDLIGTKIKIELWRNNYTIIINYLTEKEMKKLLPLIKELVG